MGREIEAKHPKQISEKSIRRWNHRIPKALEVEDAALPKKLRKPRYSPFDALENNATDVISVKAEKKKHYGKTSTKRSQTLTHEAEAMKLSDYIAGVAAIFLQEVLPLAT